MLRCELWNLWKKFQKVKQIQKHDKVSYLIFFNVTDTYLKFHDCRPETSDVLAFGGWGSTYLHT